MVIFRLMNVIESVKGVVSNPTQILSSVMRSLDGKNPGPAKKLLNLVLPQVIPFNRPLGLKINKLTTTQCEVALPLRRATKNHLGGLHACALATAGEYAAGILILRRMDPAKQRLVLKTLEVDYLKQGRGQAFARAMWPGDAPQALDAFRDSEESQELSLLTVLESSDGTPLAHVKTHWQVKPWAKVRKGT